MHSGMHMFLANRLSMLFLVPISRTMAMAINNMSHSTRRHRFYGTGPEQRKAADRILERSMRIRSQRTEQAV